MHSRLNVKLILQKRMPLVTKVKHCDKKCCNYTTTLPSSCGVFNRKQNSYSVWRQRNQAQIGEVEVV